MRYELWRRAKGDVFERWEEQTCSFNPAKPAEPVSIETEGAAAVQGMRHRLQVSVLHASEKVMINYKHQQQFTPLHTKHVQRDKLCYAMLCYAMLCYAMLCYAMLCYASYTMQRNKL